MKYTYLQPRGDHVEALLWTCVLGDGRWPVRHYSPPGLWQSQWVEFYIPLNTYHHYRSFQKQVFTANHLHWYWQLKTNNRKYIKLAQGKKNTQKHTKYPKLKSKPVGLSTHVRTAHMYVLITVQLCLCCCHTSCLEQPAGGGAVILTSAGVPASSQIWAFLAILGP